MTIEEIAAALTQSQEGFLALLEQFSQESLHKQQATEPWTPAVIMLHMCEARAHYAGDVNKLVDSDFTEVVGRSTDDPGRLAMIARAAAGSIESDAIRTQLLSSFAEMMAAVHRVEATMMNRPVQIVRPDFPDMTCADFLTRFLVGHHRLHVDHLAALV